MRHDQRDARPTVPFSAIEHHRPFIGAISCCLVTEAVRSKTVFVCLSDCHYMITVMLVSLSRAASLDGRLPILVAFRYIH